MPRLRLSLFLLFACTLLPRVVLAHNVEITHINVIFLPDDRYQIDLMYDAHAWMAGVQGKHLTPEEADAFLAQSDAAKARREVELRDFIRRRVKLYFDGNALDPTDRAMAYEIELPTRSPAPDEMKTAAKLPPRFIRLTGPLPPGASEFQLFCSRTFGNVILTIQHGNDGEPTLQSLEKGERSRPYPLKTLAPAQSRLVVARDFLISGFKHILPLGWDHIAFVIGLFLLSTKWKPLLWQITAFTVAHSITLSLAVLKVVSIPESFQATVVEPMIALSIAFVAIENIFTSKLHPWRPVVVFLFGLLHGLGFAGVLLERGIPQDSYVTALASFNVGVELGQLTVIACAFLLVGWFQRAVWYRKRIVIPASSAIAVLGLWVAVERFIG